MSKARDRRNFTEEFLSFLIIWKKEQIDTADRQQMNHKDGLFRGNSRSRPR